MVTKNILKQYTDLQEEIKEVRVRIEKTEKRLDQIESEGLVYDKVRGGEGGIQSFKIEGFPYPEYSKERNLLASRRSILENLEAELEDTVNQVETFIASVDDSRMRRIIRMRFIENLSWNRIADRIGGGNTEDSIRMAFNRFMEK